MTRAIKKDQYQDNVLMENFFRNPVAYCQVNPATAVELVQRQEDPDVQFDMLFAKHAQNITNGACALVAAEKGRDVLDLLERQPPERRVEALMADQAAITYGVIRWGMAQQLNQFMGHLPQAQQQVLLRNKDVLLAFREDDRQRKAVNEIIHKWPENDRNQFVADVKEMFGANETETVQPAVSVVHPKLLKRATTAVLHHFRHN